MPRFLDPENPSLNLLVKAKRVVVARNKKRFQGADPAYQAEMAALGQKQQGASVIFDGLLTLLTNIDATALEIKSTLQLAGGTGGRVGFADRYLASNSSMIKLVTSLQQQMQKLNYSFDIFSEPQMKDLAAKYAAADSLISESEALVSELRGRRNNEWIGQAWDQLTQSSWLGVWKDTSEKMAAGFKSYKYGLATPQVQGAGRRTRKRVGGQGPAGREPFQYTTFASSLGQFPPRNTQDLPYLPRRFV